MSDSYDEFNKKLAESGENIEDYCNEAKTLVVQNEAVADGFDLDKIDEYQDYLQDNYTGLKDNTAAATEYAYALLKLERGEESLINNIDKWKEGLALPNTTDDHIEALKGIREALGDIYQIDGNTIGETFIADNIDLIGQAANGSEVALDTLTQKLIDLEFAELEASATTDIQKAAINDLKAAMEQIEGKEYQAGVRVDIVANVSQTLTKAGLSTQILNALGFTDDGRYINRLNSDWFKSKKKSSGSGSGSGSKSKPKTKDVDAESERYYTITRQIKDQEDAINRLGKAKDRAWGAEKIRLINQEADAISKELDLQYKYLDEIEEYYKKDQEQMNALGAQFDENGVVTNYDEIMKREIDAYNAGEGSEEAENRWKWVQDTIKQYDETNQLYQSTLDNIQDLKDKYYDEKLEAIETKVSIRVEIDDYELELLEYRISKLEDTEFEISATAAIKVNEIDININKKEAIDKSIQELLQVHGVENIEALSVMSQEELRALNFTDSEINFLTEKSKESLEIQKALETSRKEILQGPVEALKKWNEEFEGILDKIAHLEKISSTYKNFANAVKGYLSGYDEAFLSAIADANFAAANTEYQANIYALAENEKQLEEMKNKRIEYAKTASDEELRIFDKGIEEQEKRVEEFEEKVVESAEKTAEAAIEVFNAKVAESRNNTEKQIFGGNSETYASTLFDYENRDKDRHLGRADTVYELSSIIKDIDKVTEKELKGNERLIKLRERINKMLKDGTKINQTQLELLQREFELEKARADWEDARKNKNTVRMTMDSEGRFGYTYTAEDGDEEKDTFLDKYHQWEQTAEKARKELETAQMKLPKELLDNITGIYNNQNLSGQEKENLISQIREGLSDEMAESFDDYLFLLNYVQGIESQYQGQYISGLGYTGEDYSISDGMENFIKKYFDSDTVEAAKNKTMEALFGQDGFITSIGTEYKTLQKNLKDVEEALPIDPMSLLKQNVNGLNEVMPKVKDNFKNLKTEMDSLYDSIKTTITKGIDPMGAKAQKQYEAVDKVLLAYESLDKAVKDKAKEVSRTSTVGTPNIAPSTGNSSGTGNNGGNYGYIPPSFTPTPVVTKGQADKALLDLIKQIKENPSANKEKSGLVREYNDSLTQPLTFWGMPSNLITPEYMAQALLSRKLSSSPSDSALKKLYKKYINSNAVFGFDTGGYTGAWNDYEGRLAFLHQKELVLNQRDTENMLQMVEIARDAMSAIAIPSLSLSNISKGFNNNISNGDFQQTVNISADFSGVRDRGEIEAAFNSLVNQAIQYSNRKFI